MAKKSSAKKKPAGKVSGAKPAAAAPGHNSKVDRAAARKYFENLDDLHKEKGEASASYASKIGNVYERAANELGVGKKALKEAYGEHQYEKAKIARRKEMTPEQQQDVDRIVLAASWKSSPLAQAAEERTERAAIAEEVAPKAAD